MKTENYNQQQALLPKTGKHIIANFDDESIIVYQAFNSHIAKYAVQHQRFGGSHYSSTRMTWIKPNFMWMMFRAGWASKENQECILAISLKIDGFKEILRNAVYSSYQSHIYGTNENWKACLAQYQVRLQWDPDHSPTGHKLERKAIQLGLKGSIQQSFNENFILSIEDITDFVKKQKENISENFEQLQVPIERILDLSNEIDICKRIGLLNP